MTLIGTIVFITSFIGALSFGCWDNDIEIPGLYPFGAFLADWWFHDKFKPGKAHLEQHDSDGPPLVATAGSVASVNFPYPGSLVTYQQPSSYSYGASVKRAQSYTPVNGIYGVTNQKESDPTLQREYYPTAIQPNDYVAKRFLGPHAFFSDLVNTGDPLTVYNKKVFKDGSPFVAAQIGPNNPTDKRWLEAPKYKLMPPLTSTGAGEVRMPQYRNVYRSLNDYSGGEYHGGDQSFGNTPEFNYCDEFRPPWYEETFDGVSLGKQPHIVSFPGEQYAPVQTPVINGTSTFMQSAFYDPQYDGVKETYYTNNETDSYVGYGWGTNASGVKSNVDGYAYSGSTINPTSITTDYIETQLVQENPISNLNSFSKPKSDQPIETHNVSQKKKYKPK